MASNLVGVASRNCILVSISILLGEGICLGGDGRFVFVAIEPGAFLMGCSSGRDDCSADEGPAHLVKLGRGFEIGKYEVTQAQWTLVMGSNPSHFRGPALPVDNVSWLAAQDFIARLNRAAGPYLYRLPTEAEWEYAARAGATGQRIGDLDEVAWHGSNSEDRTHEVGTKRPNAWGLHDMLGNVWEWCSDRYGADYYSKSPSADPRGPSEGGFRVMRGGSWYRYAWFLRHSARFWGRPDAAYRHVGFRCVRTKR